MIPDKHIDMPRIPENEELFRSCHEELNKAMDELRKKEREERERKYGKRKRKE